MLKISYFFLSHLFSVCMCVSEQLWLHRCDESLKAGSLGRHNTTAGCPALHLTNPLAALALQTSHSFPSPFLQYFASSVFITSQNRLQWHRDQLDCETPFE